MTRGRRLFRTVLAAGLLPVTALTVPAAGAGELPRLVASRATAASGAAAAPVVDVRRLGPARARDAAMWDFRLLPEGIYTSQPLRYPGGGWDSNAVTRTPLTYRAGVPQAGRSIGLGKTEIGWDVLGNISAGRMAQGRTKFVGSEGIPIFDGRRLTGRVPQEQLAPGSVQGVLSGPYLYLATSAGSSKLVGPHGRKIGNFRWSGDSNEDFFGPWRVRTRGRTATVVHATNGTRHTVTVPLATLRTVSGTPYRVNHVKFVDAQMIGPHLLLSSSSALNDGGGACPVDLPADCSEKDRLTQLYAIVDWTTGKVIAVRGTIAFHTDYQLVEGGVISADQEFDAQWKATRYTLNYINHEDLTPAPFYRHRGRFPGFGGVQGRTLLLPPEPRRGARPLLITVAPGVFAPQDARLLGTWNGRWNRARRSWSPEFDFTQQLRRWTLTIRDTRGNTVRTLRGDSPTGSVRPHWDGRTANGRRVRAGTYRWTLTGTTPTGDRVVDTLDGPVGGTVVVN